MLKDCKTDGYTANLLTVKVGSRGFIHYSCFDSLYKLVPSKRCKQEALEAEIVRICMQESYTVSGAKEIGERLRSSPELRAAMTNQSIPVFLIADSNFGLHTFFV